MENQKLELTQEWDKTFPQSDKVDQLDVIPFDKIEEFFAANLK